MRLAMHLTQCKLFNDELRDASEIVMVSVSQMERSEPHYRKITREKATSLWNIKHH